MSVDNKYLSKLEKYKYKYAYDKILEKINKIYDASSFIRVDNNKKKNGDTEYNLTYGEITNDGIRNIIKFLKEEKLSCCNFMDLGCGNGRSLALARLNGFTYALGVEIVDTRYDFALNAIEKLSSKIKENIVIEKEDLFNLDSSFFLENSVIFISNLCFPEETNQKLFTFLSKYVPASSIIIVSKIPNVEDLHTFKMYKKINIPMSWAQSSECFILIK